jgi:hypothetical protein
MDAAHASLTVTFDKIRDIVERDFGSDCRLYVLIADQAYVAACHTFDRAAIGNLLFEWLQKEGYISIESQMKSGGGQVC